MKFVVELFDYVFYRILKFYIGQGNSMPDTFASSLLVALQCLTLVDIMLIIRSIYYYTFPNKFFFIVPIVVLRVVNWHRYEKDDKFKRIEHYWAGKDGSESKIGGWLVVLYIAVSFLIPIIYGVML